MTRFDRLYLLACVLFVIFGIVWGGYLVPGLLDLDGSRR